MNGELKMTVTIFAGVALIFGMIFTAICGSEYLGNNQKIQCQKVNLSRSAIEVNLLCGKLNS